MISRFFAKASRENQHPDFFFENRLYAKSEHRRLGEDNARGLCTTYT